MSDSVISYTSKDFASLREAMLTDARVRLPEWTSRSANDFGVVLIEEFAYVGDILNYYIDQLVRESFLTTAVQRSSVLNIAALLDYRPDGVLPSTVNLTVTVSAGSDLVLIPAGSKFSASAPPSTLIPEIVFETDQDLLVQQIGTPSTGTVAATQGETQSNESVATSDGVASQAYSLAIPSVIEGSVRLYVNAGSGAALWTFREHLIDAGPRDATYTTYVSSDGITIVQFGDGVNGAIPPSGSIITASYRTGLGTFGNVGAGAITTVVSAPPQVYAVRNQSSAVGGASIESIDSIRTNAPKSLSALNRAVTLADYANLCLQVSTVSKAAAKGLTYTGITVAVVPAGGGLPSQALKQRVLAYLADKKMVNAHISIADPVYVPLLMKVTIEVQSSFAQQSVRTGVLNALTDIIAPDAAQFGQRITAATLYQAASQVAGVLSITVNTLTRNFSATSVDDITLGALEIPLAATSPIVVTVASGGIPAMVGGGGGGGSVSVVPGAPGAPTVDSLTCPAGAGYAGAFNLQIHWTAALNATSYGVLLDFYNGSTYLGSNPGGVTTGTSTTVMQGFAGSADTLHIRVRAYNGDNFTDSAVTSVAYTCGSNTP